jgi:hypothetical protein
MEILIHSTDRIVTVKNKAGAEIPGRIWEGETDSGIPVVCVVTRIAIPKDQDQTQFKAELQEHAAPTDLAVKAFPIRMLI